MSGLMRGTAAVRPPLEGDHRPQVNEGPLTIDAFRDRVAAHPERVALRPLTGDAMTWRAWGDAAGQVTAALVTCGVSPGERVVVLAANHVVWPIADLGILEAGAVSVGAYPTSAPEQLLNIVNDSGARVLIVDDAEQLAKARAIAARAPTLALIVHCVSLDVTSAPDATGPVVREVAWADWLAAGAEALRDGALRLDLSQRRAAIVGDSLAVLIYTSGSTGTPKGARLTHRYLAASARSILEALPLDETDSAVSFLPASHAAERVFGIYARIHAGMEAVLVGEPANVWDACRRHNPTLFGGVPRFYEKLYEALMTAQLTALGVDRERWETALTLGRARSTLRRGGRALAPGDESRWLAALAPVTPVLHGLLGTRVRLATSGGAALAHDVAETLDACGLTVLGAYGLTEHLCVAFHRPGHYGFDSVGTAMAGSALRIADDGELLVKRGALTFDGYWQRDAETAAAFTPDGEWLHTGDAGTIAADGTLRITGRIKELIALSTGKKVAPLPIEAALIADPWISQAVLHGEGEKYVVALLALRRDVVLAWASTAGLPLDLETLVVLPEVQARVQWAIDRVNATVSRSEQVRKWSLLDRELTVDAGELTPTMKVRRAVVAVRHAERLASLYR